MLLNTLATLARESQVAILIAARSAAEAVDAGSVMTLGGGKIFGDPSPWRDDEDGSNGRASVVQIDRATRGQRDKETPDD